MSLENGKTAAYVRDGALIVEFGSSSQPFIWRYDLSKVHAVLFSVKSEGGAWSLGLEGPKGEFTSVTAFASEIKAKAALSAIAAALRAQDGERRAYGRVANAVLLLVALFAAVAAWTLLDSAVKRATSGAPSATQAAVVRPVPQGQAVAADQALQAPPPRQ